MKEQCSFALILITKKMSFRQHITTFLIVVITSLLASLFWMKILTTFDLKNEQMMMIMSKRNSSSNNNSMPKNYKILIYASQSYLKPFIEHFKKTKCPSVPNCIISENQKEMADSHAVIFNGVHLPGKPPNKPQRQLWVFHSMETVHFIHKPNKLWDDKFDLTMSFRRHSDIVRPYGKIVRREKELKRNYSDVFHKKKYGGVWMSGHCPVPSRRKAFAQEIGKHMHVDLFGRCGTRPCGGRTTMLSECLKNVSRDYKFYFSFENTMCPDYTTEKLFNLYLYDLEIIPVVNGPANAADYLPKGTFINALDFKSAAELAKKLLEIGSNEEQYTQYLKEKDKYYDAGNSVVFSDAVCQLCNKIANNYTKSSQNYWAWMLKNGC
ncbi:glycoprotein 3-alpha-L-fucosyltransferase A-like isoform X5 [Crassostrea virginica]